MLIGNWTAGLVIVFLVEWDHVNLTNEVKISAGLVGYIYIYIHGILMYFISGLSEKAVFKLGGK